jgi:hypothetical protein
VFLNPPPPERKIKDRTLWRGLPTLKRKKKTPSSVSVRRVGYVGAPAIPGFVAHRGEEKKKEKKLRMILRTQSNWKLIREVLGRRWP